MRSPAIMMVGIAICLHLAGCSSHPQTPKIPDLIMADGKIMAGSLAKIQAGHPLLKNLIRILKSDADKALRVDSVSVMQKTKVPPSGDKHDYMSQGPYWWPDPKKPDGLPYIRRDGEVNPEKNELTDHDGFNRVMNMTDILGKAYFFTGEEKYAEKAAMLIRVWFLNEDSRMNPNLNFGQAIPGRTEGRGIGIIESRKIGMILDAIILIRPSKAWTREDEAGMQAWCREYLNWLLTSKHGQDESVHPNNHGTWYDVQTSALAIFTGQDDIARDLLEKASSRRLDAHIQEDGTQPLELARTRSWNYSVMNLWGLFRLARLGEHIGVDLWNYPSSEDSKLSAALDYLIPFALGEEEWPHEQITKFEPESLMPHLQVANRMFPDKNYEEVLTKLRLRYPDEERHAILWR